MSTANAAQVRKDRNARGTLVDFQAPVPAP